MKLFQRSIVTYSRSVYTLKKQGFKITPENVDFLMGGVKAIQDDPIKKRIVKNLHFEGQFISEQTKKKLTQVWW